jgi:hypothetical protein
MADSVVRIAGIDADRHEACPSFGLTRDFELLEDVRNVGVDSFLMAGERRGLRDTGAP